MILPIDKHRHSLLLEPVGASDYPLSTIDCAQFFLGCILLKARVTKFAGPGNYSGIEALAAGLIIETEAYTSDDSASHSWRGRTERNQAMFSQAGNLYVYRSYGIHHCANIVVGPGNAVLIRSLFPIAGMQKMVARRNVQEYRRLCSGPGNLCAAMGIDMRHNCYPLTPPEQLRQFTILHTYSAQEPQQLHPPVPQAAQDLLRNYYGNPEDHDYHGPVAILGLLKPHSHESIQNIIGERIERIER